MLTLWALAIMLAVQAEAFDLLTPPSLPGNLPIAIPSELSLKLPVRVPLPSIPIFRSIPKGSPPIKHPAGTSGAENLPVARYFVSNSRLGDYLNTILPLKIEKLLKCEEINLAGVLGEVISTVSNLDVLSLLDITSALSILGDGSLGGLLGKGSNQSPKLPVPLVSEATDAVGGLVSVGQEALGSLPLIGAEKNPVKEPVDNTGLLTGNKLKEFTTDTLSSVVPEDVNNALKGLLGNIKVEDLLIGLEVQKVTVENMTSTMTADGILVHAITTAFIGGKGLAGPIVSLLGFQVNSDLTLKIKVSTNNTQCVNLQVQDKDIEVKKVSLQLLKVVTDSLPVCLPLDDVIRSLLTVTMKENIKESKLCDIELSDVNECKNATGLFKYHVKSVRTSPESLSIFYSTHFRQNTSPVPGSLLPLDPKNASVSLTLSHEMLKAIISQSAKQSSIKMNNLDAKITKIAYIHQPGSKIEGTYWVDVEENGEKFATGETTIIISHKGKISKDKLTAGIRILSSEYSVTPPEAKNKVQDVLSTVLEKLLPAITENLNQWNVPPGITSNLLNNTKVQVLKSKDFRAAN